jgi:hypothetical protein
MTQASLSEFLGYVQGQKEAALVIFSEYTNLIDASRELADVGYVRASPPIDVLDLLAKGSSVVATISHPIPKQWYDILAQYSERGGMVQLMDKETMEYKVAQFDPLHTHLVVLVSSGDLAKIEAEGFVIRDKVGLIEQV